MTHDFGRSRRVSPFHVGLAGTLAIMLAGLTGCGYNLPLLARPAATAAPQAVATRRAKESHKDAEPTAKAETRSRHGKAGHAGVPRNEPPHDTSLRGQLAEARERTALLPPDSYWPYHIATLCVALDSIDAAQVALNQSLAHDPGYAPALALVSKLDYAAGRYDDAIAVLETARMAAQRNSKDLAPELLAGLALHYDAAGRPADAREALASVPASEHKAADAAAAAIALRHADRVAGAGLAEAAVHDSPNSAACQNNAGIARLQAGDVKAARMAFHKAIALDPRLAGPYYNLAILEKYYTMDDAAALSWFAQYRALSNDDPDGLAQVLGHGEQKDLAEGSKP